MDNPRSNDKPQADRMAAKSKTSSSPTPVKVGFWHAVRDITIASINKGQFPLAIVAAIVLSIIWKMPPADVSALASAILDAFQKMDLVGWILFFAVSGVWLGMAQRTRQTRRNEIERIGKEKSLLQQNKLGPDATSSQRP